MRLDEELIKDGITVKLIAELIEKHERRNGRYSKLMNYTGEITQFVTENERRTDWRIIK